MIQFLQRRAEALTKHDILKSNGTYNIGSDSVVASDFQHGIFFDPHDLVQVKYEMLRSVAKKELSVSEASAKYGLSRQSYYSNKAAFDKEGIAALMPKKTGPKTNFKLNQEGRQFIDRYLVEHPNANTHSIKVALEENTGIAVHDRTVNRYISKTRRGSR